MLRFATVCVFVATAVAGATAAAQPLHPDLTPVRHRLSWDEDWRRSNWIDYATTTAVAAYALYLQFEVPRPTTSHWSRPILIDAEVHAATVGGSAATRNTAAKLGDAGFYSLQLLPFVDSLVTPLATDDLNEDVAWELSMMNLQATSTVFALARTGHRFVGRSRPDVDACTTDQSFSDACFGGPYSSFPSGHAAAAFAGAGLMCAHHTRLPLWGAPEADAAACVIPLGLATATGATRLIAARHWVSDVVVGALLGFGVGYGMPTLLHYAPLGGESRALSLRWGVHPFVAGGGEGLAVSGMF